MTNRIKEIEYYAIMAKKRSKLAPLGQGLDIVCFKVKDGKQVRVNDYVKTYMYYNPVLKLFCVHEMLCGLMIGSGLTETDALANTVKFFKEADESMFFVQAEAFGPATNHPEVSWEHAMKCYAAAAKEKMSSN